MTSFPMYQRTFDDLSIARSLDGKSWTAFPEVARKGFSYAGEPSQDVLTQAGQWVAEQS